jgi:hypothetical protein
MSAQSSTSANASKQTSVAKPEHAQQSDADAEQHDAKAREANKSQASASEQHHKSKDAEHSAKTKSAESNSQKSTTANATNSLAAGTTVNAVLAKPLDSRKCKSGDEVVATATQDVKSDGKIVLRKGSKLIGHVTEAKAKADGASESSLGIVFDHAVLKNGQQVQMNSVIQSLAAAQASPTSGDGDLEMMNTGSMATSAGAHRGAGLVNAAGSSASRVAGGVAHTGGDLTASTTSALNTRASAGKGVSGAATAANGGVVGLKGLSLASNAGSSSSSVITSTGKSVQLQSGTQMVLSVVK